MWGVLLQAHSRLLRSQEGRIRHAPSPSMKGLVRTPSPAGLTESAPDVFAAGALGPRSSGRWHCRGTGRREGATALSLGRSRPCVCSPVQSPIRAGGGPPSPGCLCGPWAWIYVSLWVCLCAHLAVGLSGHLPLSVGGLSGRRPPLAWSAISWAREELPRPAARPAAG